MANTTTSTLGAIIICAVSAGCGPQEETIHDIKAALERPAGGYSFDPEVPLLGRPELDMAPVNVALPAELPPGDGPGGVLVGMWWDFEKAHGVMLGKWADEFGQVVGHVKGLYGRSQAQRGWVYYGKLVDLQGQARALLSGRFSHGVFQGEMMDAEGQSVGQLDGLSNRRGLSEGWLVGRWTLRDAALVAAR